MSLGNLDLNVPPEESAKFRPMTTIDYYGSIWKDNLLVSFVTVKNLPIALPTHLNIEGFESVAFCPLRELPSFELHPYYPAHNQGRGPDQRAEWVKFVTYFHKRNKVVLIPIDGWELLIRPPTVVLDERTPVRVCYRKLMTNKPAGQQLHPAHQVDHMMRPRAEVLDPPTVGHGALCPRPNLDSNSWRPDQRFLDHLAGNRVVNVPSSAANVPTSFPVNFPTNVPVNLPTNVPVNLPTNIPVSVASNVATTVLQASQAPVLKPRLGLMHPSYLQTLAQTHASWLFGALAELVDNARDAQASRLHINISMTKVKGRHDLIPVLLVADDGKGMKHEEIVRMLSFGHPNATEDDKDHIGHFGVGFKTGSMRLGRDAVVLTQSEDSRSIGLLSSSYNADKEVLEVPIVTYRKVHGIMEMDLTVQSEAEGQACLDAVKKYSPYSEFEIGSLLDKIGGDKSKNGTHIFIYNLETWGSQFAFDWTKDDDQQNVDQQKDIIIRSKRVRTRPGQTSKEIPLDYSLRSYLEVLFLEPRMIITVQGSRVKTKRLAASLNTTQLVKGKVLGKHVRLTLGRSPVEYKRGNCGVFLYWHGRLIEAYRRVGGMVHSSDMGRGVIGVIDVTPLMDNFEGRIGVLNTKQGFEDSEEYAMLEKWLGEEFSKYWYTHFDNIEVIQPKGNGGPIFEPDREWVQCDKCQRWRKLPHGVHAQDLTEEWFCYMKPYQGTCKDPEEKADEGIVTVGVARTSEPAIRTPVIPSRGLARTRITPKDLDLEGDDVEEPSIPEPSGKQLRKKSGTFGMKPSQSAEIKLIAEKFLGNESPTRKRLRKKR